LAGVPAALLLSLPVSVSYVDAGNAGKESCVNHFGCVFVFCVGECAQHERHPAGAVPGEPDEGSGLVLPGQLQGLTLQGQGLWVEARGSCQQKLKRHALQE